MELNKYDLVEHLALKLEDIACSDCLINEECHKDGKAIFICFDKDKTKDLLIKKYNL